MCDLFSVEDEALIRMMIADMVEELGHRAITEVGRLDVARPLAQSAKFDVAILDINVGGYSIFPIASIIENRGLVVKQLLDYRSPFAIDQCCQALRNREHAAQ